MHVAKTNFSPNLAHKTGNISKRNEMEANYSIKLSLKSLKGSL